MKIRIQIDVEVSQPFDNAEQERYVLATIEDALEPMIWFELLANEKTAPQKFTNANARIVSRDAGRAALAISEEQKP